MFKLVKKVLFEQRHPKGEGTKGDWHWILGFYVQKHVKVSLFIMEPASHIKTHRLIEFYRI